MVTYDYLCLDCEREFEIRMEMAGLLRVKNGPLAVQSRRAHAGVSGSFHRNDGQGNVPCQRRNTLPLATAQK